MVVKITNKDQRTLLIEFDSDEETKLYKLAENIYSSFNLKEAEGDSLDVLGLLKGIERKAAKKRNLKLNKL